MKRIAGMLITVLLVLCMVFALPLNASAASSAAQDGLEVAIATDKDVYSKEEDIQVTVTIKNTNDYIMTDISVETLIPEGLEIKAGTAQLAALDLAAGATETVSLTAKLKTPTGGDSTGGTTGGSTGGTTGGSTGGSSSATGGNASGKDLPTTGDKSNIFLWILIFGVSTCGIVFIANHKKATKIISLCVCVAIIAATLGIGAVTDKVRTISVDKTITVGDVTYKISTEVKYVIDDAEKMIYVVTFDSNGGSAIEAQDVMEGNTVEYPEIPVREGYAFVGWYADSEFENVFDFSTGIYASCKLFARWVDITDTTDTDGDGLIDAIEEVYGTNKKKTDSDGDGLSDFVEVLKLKFNPLNKDTDGDGITDDNEDSDSDTLTNKEEIERGTEPAMADTDTDGLNDNKEIDAYNTDPCDPDSDSDGLNDGDEIKLGLNPLAPMSDGKTPDAERIIEQSLDSDRVSEQLLAEENDAVPSLKATASGNINSDITISPTESLDFGDSRAIVGEVIDISGKNVPEAKLTFSLKKEAVATFAVDDATKTFNTNLICKYKEDGTTEYLDTVFDAANNTISADISGEGTYFVLDVKNLFDELGLEMPEVSDISALAETKPAMVDSAVRADNGEKVIASTQPELKNSATGVATTEPAKVNTDKVITRAADGAMAQADIVFIIDTTGSMSDEINSVKENVEAFVDVLKRKGVSAGLALIDYQDIEADGYDSTRVHKNGTSNWFYNMDTYKTVISNLELGWGGDTPECAVDALETARLLDMRASAGKIFILVTDADYKVDNRYGIPSMAAEIELLKNAGVTCAVVSPSYEKETYYDLFNETDGIWADIYGDFHNELMALADKIGSDIVGDGYWIYLQGPVPVPVRLDQKPTEGSLVDTDKDGLSDVAELGSATPTGSVDLDELITKVSRGVITGTDYGVVKTYKYKSNPIESNTDGDEYGDSVDPQPKIYTITDRTLAMAQGLSYTNLKDYIGYTVGQAVENGAALKGVSKEYITLLKDAVIIYANDSSSGYWGDFFDKGLGSLALKFIRPGDTTAVVYSLRGTEIETDFINDFLITDIDLGLSKDSFQSKVAFYEYKAIANNKDYDYYITGHSLGGRLALDVLYKVYEANKDGWFSKGADIPTPVHSVTFNGLGYNAVTYWMLGDTVEKYAGKLTNYYYWNDLIGEEMGASGTFTRPGQQVLLQCKDITGKKRRSDSEIASIKYPDIDYHGIEFFQNDYDLLWSSAHGFSYWVDQYEDFFKNVWKCCDQCSIAVSGKYSSNAFCIYVTVFNETNVFELFDSVCCDWSDCGVSNGFWNY